MAYPTADEIVKQAQRYVNDEAGLKWDADDLLAYLNTGIQLLYTKHPSAFYVTTVITEAPAVAEISSSIPVFSRYAEPLAHFIAAQCLVEGADDQFNKALAQEHLNLFASLSA